jgi:small subunit ribosomal protein S20
MPITQSAKKALRGSLKKRAFNLRRKNEMDKVIKEVKKLINQKNAKDARTALSRAYKAIDKAAKRGIIKKNTAARKKSRLSALIKKSA